jgi:hypothetical protein
MKCQVNDAQLGISPPVASDKHQFRASAVGRGSFPAKEAVGLRAQPSHARPISR